ncbi:30S ribosomal protein S19e [Candidatus Alkanophaga liquidiphilum]|nr:Ribosomal protein S19E [Candidatus Alkanophaga liquidiphilum]RLG39074.1 MAG: 30S ribosomal protein S19e [Candidatus Alkanophagales archaeon]
MTTVYDVPQDKLVQLAAEKLKRGKGIAPPKWAAFVKGGISNELPPQQEDWWWTRCASVLRQIYIHGPVGVSRLRTYYGGKRRRGVKPPHFRKGSGKIVREVLQQLERAGLVIKTKKGRKISPKGQAFLDNVAYELKLMLETEGAKTVEKAEAVAGEA